MKMQEIVQERLTELVEKTCKINDTLFHIASTLADKAELSSEKLDEINAILDEVDSALTQAGISAKRGRS